MPILKKNKPIFLADDTITQPDLHELSNWILAGNRLTKACSGAICKTSEARSKKSVSRSKYNHNSRCLSSERVPGLSTFGRCFW